MAERRAAMLAWLEAVLPGVEPAIETASSDASFRSYWRVFAQGRSYVVMDAPPGLEGTEDFVRIARQLREIGLNTPQIHARSSEAGFLLMSDLGTCQYLDHLTEQSVERLYGDALGALVTIQACGPLDGLPVYDAPFLRLELELFREWLLGRHLGMTLSIAETSMLEAVFTRLIDNALEQPQVCVHRDFHSRNLMVTGPPSPGILDFQDAVIGPVTYDLVSLLRDCYIGWPEDRVRDWSDGYFHLAVQSGILRPGQEGRFRVWFDLMGMQRHLKAAGIFARLKHRDGKSGYLADIPRTLSYVINVARRYPELAKLGNFIESRVCAALS